jgi:Protein of unknown function (DUF616)
MNQTAVYTSVMGQYGELLAHPEIPGVDWIAFVDTPMERADWETRVLRPDPNPRLAAKRFKMLPHVYLEDHAQTIWIDGTVQITSPSFVDEALACVGESGIALWRHPERDCAYQETIVSAQMPKYANLPIYAQAAHYRAQGFPPHYGLWACGIMARRTAEPSVAKLGEMWLAEVERWSIQDQISFPWVLRELGIVPGEFPAGLYANPWLRITAHNPNY